MTARDKQNLDPEIRKKMARLMQIHQITHPKRIAQRYGVTAEYVRRIWTNLPVDEQAPAQEAIAFLTSGAPQAA